MKSSIVLSYSLFFGLANASIHHFEDNLTQNFDTYSNTVLSYSGHGDTLKQSFVVKTADPKTTAVKAQILFLKSYLWGGTGATYRIEIRPGDIDSLNAPVLLSYDYSKLATLDGESGIQTRSSSYIPLSPKLDPDTLMAIYNRTSSVDSASKRYFTEGVPLGVGKKYTLSLIARNLPNRSYGFYTANSDDPNGRNNWGNDLFFQLFGFAENGLDSTLRFRQGTGNQFFLDTVGRPFPSKIIGINQSEKVEIWGNSSSSLSFMIKDPTLLSLTNLGGTNPQVISLQGIKQGNTLVYVLRGSDTAQILQVDIAPQRHLNLSYTYIRHPNEDTTAQTKTFTSGNDTIKLVNYELRKQFSGISTNMTRFYDSLNIALHWTDNGIIRYNWDFNADQNSYTGTMDETWSPLDSNLIPNPAKVHTNLFLIRDRFPDIGGTGQSGGGSSRDALDNSSKPKRGAYKRSHLLCAPKGLASTLSHELAHNLGLGHYSEQNASFFPAPNSQTNLMKTGRNFDNMLGFQWRTIHSRIDSLKSKGEDYTPTQTVPIHPKPSFVAQKFGDLIEISSPSEGQLQIYDASGHLRIEFQIEAGQQTLSLSSNFSRGSYLLVFMNQRQSYRQMIYW